MKPNFKQGTNTTMATTAVMIPETPEGLTAEWMTACLRETGAIGGGRVTSVRVERFAEGVGRSRITGLFSILYN